jgi:hypothetical protein
MSHYRDEVAVTAQVSISNGKRTDNVEPDQVATQNRLDGDDLIVEQGPELGKRDRHSHTVGRQPTCAP